MQLQGKSIRRALVITFVGIFVVFLLAFFVSIFFVSRGNSYSADYSGRGMVETSTVTPSGVTAFMDPASLGSVNGDRQAIEKSTTAGVMLDTVTTSPVVAEKKMIKNGSLNLRVQSVDQALVQIGSIAKDLGGDISNSYFTQASSGMKNGNVMVKVPVDKFSEALVRIKEIATVVKSENISGVDVTERYIDLQARINNKRIAEVTLQGLFQRAEKISDVIEVTDKLAAVRSEIESLDGQLRYLGAQTDQASITLALTEDVTIVTDRGFRPLQTIKESLHILVQILEDFFLGLIRFLIVGLPVLLAYGFVLWIIYRLARRMVTKCWLGNAKMEQKITRKK